MLFLPLFEFSLSNSLTTLLNQVVAGLPKFFFAIIVLILGIFISKLVAKMIKAALQKLNIDALGEKLNEIEIVDKSNIRIKLSDVISKIFYYILLLFVLVVATDILDLEPVSNLVVGIFEFMPKLIVALIILVFGTLLADGIRSIVQTACDSLGIPSSKLIASFLFYFLFINIFVSALSQAEINTEFLSTNISILIAGLVLAFAIGYGLSTKSTMTNYLASFYTNDRFNIGDRVTLDGITGLIVEMDKRSVTIDTGSSRVLFPLSKLLNEKIEIHN